MNDEGRWLSAAFIDLSFELEDFIASSQFSFHMCPFMDVTSANVISAVRLPERAG